MHNNTTIVQLIRSLLLCQVPTNMTQLSIKLLASHHYVRIINVWNVRLFFLLFSRKYIYLDVWTISLLLLSLRCQRPFLQLSLSSLFFLYYVSFDRFLPFSLLYISTSELSLSRILLECRRSVLLLLVIRV